MAAGVLAMQLVWVFAVPPFRGSDEFDHVYKAAAVARGEWFPSPSAATRGTGAWLEVPNDIVRAARPQCRSLSYTQDEDCLGQPHGDTTRIASGAGRYHPLYYSIVGSVALPFSGHAALYAMRLTSALLCWLLFTAAIAVTRSWAATAWPLVTVAVSATPVLLYSSAMVAPNGVEMVAAIAFWSGLVGIVRARPDRIPSRTLVLTAVAGTVLTTVRSFGPLWGLMAVLTVLLACWPGRERLVELLRSRRVRAAAAVVVASALLSTAWTLRMGALNVGNALDEPYSVSRRIDLLASQVPVWVFQSIAAFPLRNEPTQPVVYGCYLVLFIALAGGGLVVARNTLRAGILIACVAALLVPFAISVATFNAHAAVWQGRYSLPYSVGITVLLGVALDRPGHGPVDLRLAIGGLFLFVTAQVVGPVDVMRKSLRHPLADFGSWVHPSAWLLALGATLAAAVVWWTATRNTLGQTTPSSPAPR